MDEILGMDGMNAMNGMNGMNLMYWMYRMGWGGMGWDRLNGMDWVDGMDGTGLLSHRHSKAIWTTMVTYTMIVSGMPVNRKDICTEDRIQTMRC